MFIYKLEAVEKGRYSDHEGDYVIGYFSSRDFAVRAFHMAEVDTENYAMWVEEIELDKVG